jgi:hypothetical protein
MSATSASSPRLFALDLNGQAGPSYFTVGGYNHTSYQGSIQVQPLMSTPSDLLRHRIFICVHSGREQYCLGPLGWAC